MRRRRPAMEVFVPRGGCKGKAGRKRKEKKKKNNNNKKTAQLFKYIESEVDVD